MSLVSCAFGTVFVFLFFYVRSGQHTLGQTGVSSFRLSRLACVNVSCFISVRKDA